MEKQKNSDSDETGDCWDYVGYDPDNKLVLSVVPGKRNKCNTNQLVSECKRRTSGYMDMITTDEYSGYKTAILNNYGVKEEQHKANTKKVGRPKKPKIVAPKELNYCVVHKTRKKGKVIKVEKRVVYGTTNGQSINTSYVERYNGTDRNFNSRKIRKSCMFSKQWETHKLITYFISYSYNFCWSVRTLNHKRSADCRYKVSPAMSAKLTDHIWDIREWLSYPVLQLN